MIKLLFLILISGQALALQEIVAPSFRLYPMAGDLTGVLKQEGILWDHRTDTNPINYSLWQLQVTGDVVGSIEIAFNYYPISFVKIEGAVGGTYRFINAPYFNCQAVDCTGFLTRNRVGISFLGATGFNNDWVVVPEYNMVFASVSQNALPIGDDSEAIIATPNSDTLDRYQIVTGKKVDNQFYGLFLRQARYRNSGQHNELQSLMYKADWRDTSFVGGVGRYASDLYVPGIAMFLYYEWRWGYSQAFF